MNSVIDIIKLRHSVRSFDGTPLKQEHIDDLQKYIARLSHPFNAKIRINLLNAEIGKDPVKLGTYGVIKGTNSFLTLTIDESPHADIEGGYMLEEVILYCTALGIGSCWLGGTVRRNDFDRQLNLGKEEHLVAVSPIGYKTEKRRKLDSMMRKLAGSDHRKPFGSLFFDGNFDKPLTEESAGRYLVPLQMLRLAPSASNGQPWRIIKEKDSFHFYHHPAPFSRNDVGIALCHFDLTCRELGITGSFEEINCNHISTNHNKYVLSWTPSHISRAKDFI